MSHLTGRIFLWLSGFLETVSHMHACRAVMTKLSSGSTRLQLAGPVDQCDTEPSPWFHNMAETSTVIRETISSTSFR